MVTVNMISGETITGKFLQENNLYVYIEAKMEYDELALELFGKEFCEQHAVQVIKLPKAEIKNIER